MTTSKEFCVFSRTAIALAVLAAFAPARAQDIGQLTAPGNSVSVGVGVVTGDEKDRARFGMFNGMRKNDYYGLFGFSYLDRDAASGRWFTLEGRNLGLDSREVGFSYRRLGDLKLWGEYSELVRHDPRTVNTGLIGGGTTTPTVVLLPTPGSGSDLNLQTKRKGIGLNVEKWFGGALQLEVNFKNEDKSGARLFGKGFACTSGTAPGCLGTTATATGWALLILPEPVNSTIRQMDVKLNYNGGNLKLTGGYYGSFYTNSNGNITPSVPGTLLNPLGTPLPLNTGLQSILNLPVALWPDNEAHQVYVAGNYSFSPKTKVNFKYAYTHATQTEDFAGMGLTGAPAGRSHLGGEINTSRLQLGFSSHPLAKLHLHGDVKYEDKDNKTPVDTYNIEGTNTFTNTAPSPTKLDGKLEASYKLPANYSVGAGVFYESEDFGNFTPTASVAGLSGIRQKLEETGYRLELRKSMSETLNGAVSYVSSRREGKSPWLKPNRLPATGVREADPGCVSTTTNDCIYSRTAIFPFIFEDRERDKFRVMANWQPTDRLSLQLFLEDGEDVLHGPTEHGLRDTGMQMASIDASYTLSDAWRLTGYVSRGKQTLNAGHSTGYDATITDTNDSVGLGIVGKVSGRMRVGADLTYLNDVLKYYQVQDPLASAANADFLAASGGLPDVTYRLTQLKLFGEYALDKSSYLRLDLVHHKTRFNEWTYSYNGVPYFYGDNTTITAKENQSVTMIGASYVYRFK